MHQRKSLKQQFFLTVLLVGLPAMAFSQVNLLDNSGFENDFSGWEQFQGRIADWNAVDADGNPDSGSALVNNAGITDEVFAIVLFQCIALEGEQQITYGGEVMVPEMQPAGTEGHIFFQPFASSDCSGFAENFQSVISSTPGVWNSVSETLITPGNTRSVRVSIGVVKPDNETTDALSFFDNLFLNASTPFQVNPSMSASWFNPAEAGHGIMIHLLDENTAWMCWFAFDNDGNPAWICALGTIMGDSLVFEDAFIIEGGAFPPDFDPEQVTSIPWGSIVVTFTGCDTGLMAWSTSIQGFQSGSMPITRLTTLWGTPCNQGG